MRRVSRAILFRADTTYPMRRRSSLALLAILVVLAIVAFMRYVSLSNQAARRVTPPGEPRDSLARLDSAARADARQDIDTMCLASRIGLPCNPF
jgi:ferric-dicitrate binding protein FerR (iron transport regulator)